MTVPSTCPRPGTDTRVRVTKPAVDSGGPPGREAIKLGAAVVGQCAVRVGDPGPGRDHGSEVDRVVHVLLVLETVAAAVVQDRRVRCGVHAADLADDPAALARRTVPW